MRTHDPATPPSPSAPSDSHAQAITDHAAPTPDDPALPAAHNRRATSSDHDAPRDHGADDLVAAVDRLLDRLARPAGDLDPDTCRARVRLGRRLQGIGAVLVAEATRALADTDQLDGAPTPTGWLRDQGTSARQAARIVRLGSTLDQLPATRTALTDGQLGVESADALVRTTRETVLGTPDQIERDLLPVALATTPEDLRAEIRTRTQAADATAMLRDERHQHARRRLTMTRRDDGMWQLTGLLTAEAGDATRTLLDTHDHPDPPDTPPGSRRRPDQRLADALETAVGAALDHTPLPGTATGRPHVTIHVDLHTLTTDLTDPDHPDQPIAPDHPSWATLAPADTTWSGHLSPQAARRICCDAGITRVVTAGGSQPLDVGRQTRTWSPAQRRAINLRDGGCRGPRCTRPIGWTHIHHLTWWRNGGTTAIDNGLALCHACHRLIHDHGWHVHLDPTTAIATWTAPDRTQTVDRPPGPPRPPPTTRPPSTQRPPGGDEGDLVRNERVQPPLQPPGVRDQPRTRR